MKNRLLAVMLALLLVLGSAFIITSCGEEGDNNGGGAPEKLDAPVVTLNGDTAVWEANQKAERFEISLNGTVSFVENTQTSQKLTDGQAIKVRAIGDGVNTKNSDWSNTVLYTASGDGEGENPDGTSPKYIITWKSGDEILETDEVTEGTVPEYNGEAPKKEGYTFIGWLPGVKAAFSSAIYVAQFIKDAPAEDDKDDTGDTEDTGDTVTVTFVDYDGTELNTQTIKKGTSATLPANPHREGFVFIGWDKDVTNVMENITVTAQYEASKLQLVITYQDFGDVVTATASLAGEVNVAMLELKLSFNLNLMSYKGYELASIDYSDANYVDGVFYYSLMTEEDITGETELFTISFDAEDVGGASVGVIVEESMASDSTFKETTTVQVIYK